MRAFTQWLALAPLLVIAGCSTLYPAPRLTSSTPALVLSEADVNLGEALAHYSQALIAEASEGASKSAVLHFRQAAALDPSQIPISLKVASDYIGRRDYTGAVTVLKALELSHPDSLEISLLLGSVYQAQGDSKAAVRQFRAAIRMAPERPDGYIRLATLFVLDLESGKALAVVHEGFRRVRDPQPLYDFCESVGRLLVAGKDSPGAISFFEKVPDNPRLAFWLGELYEQQGENQKALDAYTRAGKDEAIQLPVALRRANLEMQIDPRVALATLKEVLLKFPDDLRLRIYLALLYMQLERYPDALTQFEDVVRRVEQDQSQSQQLLPLFYFWYGSACERVGRFEEGEQYLSRYLAANPESAEALNYLAYMWAERGLKLEQADSYVVKALELEPDNGAFLDTKGWIQFKQGDYANAYRTLQRALRQAGDDPAIFEHLGDVSAALNKKQEALRWWSKSLKLSPGNNTVRDKLLEAGKKVK